jgi:predicted ArsR family transcriptional regulator
MNEPDMAARSSQEPGLRQISDAQTMRALAHPVRLELLDLIQRDGEVTATRAAEALGESPGNMSWHLHTLAKYGFVEEAGGGKGRTRPWRIAAHGNRFRTTDGDPGATAANTALASQVVERSLEQQRRWFESRAAYAAEWQSAAFLSNSTVYLTSAELAQLCEEVTELISRHSDRVDSRRRPDGALPVHLTAYGHPLPPTAAGN